MATDPELLTSVKNGVRIIKFNRPHMRNAISNSIYVEVANVLNSDALDDSIVVTIITGVGDYYSSGNDFKSSMQKFEEGDQNGDLFVLNFVNALIEYPKLVIAVVNGPAIGIAVTSLALCDIVYASDRATFETPFLKFGLCPEGCSSFLFPTIMGRSRASEMLFLGRKLSAKEAESCGLVSEVVAQDKLGGLMERLTAFGRLPLTSVKLTKNLIVQNFKSTLLKCNKREVDGLKVCFDSEDFQKAVVAFFSRKSKL